LIIEGNKVRIGIQAPSEVRIMREELCHKEPDDRRVFAEQAR
jgi:sRNA-binding carbon storage regulator CsrA